SRLISQCLYILEHHGNLIVSTNAWKFSADDFYDLPDVGFNLAHVEGLLSHNYTLPPDDRLPETYTARRYLKAFAWPEHYTTLNIKNVSKIPLVILEYTSSSQLPRF